MNSLSSQLLQGRVVLVTGGGRGIGAAISRVLARHGATVAINYSASREKAESVAREIQNSGGKAEIFQADVRNADEVNQMMSRIHESFGRLDGVVNNAIGGKQDGTFDSSPIEQYQNMFDFNCVAVLNTLRAAKPLFAEAGGGAVVNIVTELWNYGSAGWIPYLAGKGALVGISRGLANELGPEKIRINMVAPGWMVDEKVDKPDEGYAQGNPLRFHGSADEIGHACVFFLSDLSAYVTGAYLPVTGGRTTQMGN